MDKVKSAQFLHSVLGGPGGLQVMRLVSCVKVLLQLADDGLHPAGLSRCGGLPCDGPGCVSPLPHSAPPLHEAATDCMIALVTRIEWEDCPELELELGISS